MCGTGLRHWLGSIFGSRWSSDRGVPSATLAPSACFSAPVSGLYSLPVASAAEASAEDTSAIVATTPSGIFVTARGYRRSHRRAIIAGLPKVAAASAAAPTRIVIAIALRSCLALILPGVPTENIAAIVTPAPTFTVSLAASATLAVISLVAVGITTPIAAAMALTVIAVATVIAMAIATATIPVLAGPGMPALSPILVMVIAHLIPLTAPIKNKEAIAGIIIVIPPTAAIANIVKAIAVIAAVIAVVGIIWIAAIAVIGCVIRTIAGAECLVATGKAETRCCQCRNLQKCLIHISPRYLQAAVLFYQSPDSRLDRLLQLEARLSGLN